MTEVTPEGTSQINYAYDNLYRLTNETRTGVNPFTASYAYDINGNRTQKVETVNGITETINAWTWQSIDGTMIKAPTAQESVGPNPTDRGKKWNQTTYSCRRAWGPVVNRRNRS